jgi:hypothetical protein
MKDMDKIMRILGKAIGIFLLINIGYWGHYLYKYEISESIKKHREKEYYKTHGYPMTTRGGYATRDTTTMSVDSLRKKIWKDLNNR